MIGKKKKKKKKDCAIRSDLYTTYGYVSFISLNDGVNIGFCDTR